MSEATTDKTNDIIKRKPFYSDEMMIEQLNILLKVMTQTEDVKVGRGKKAAIIKRLKYDEPEVLDRIKRSIKHYTQCSLENTKKK